MPIVPAHHQLADSGRDPAAVHDAGASVRCELDVEQFQDGVSHSGPRSPVTSALRVIPDAGFSGERLQEAAPSQSCLEISMTEVESHFLSWSTHLERLALRSLNR